MTDEQIVLNRDEFRIWLEVHKYEAVGEPGWPGSCPIARYLCEQSGLESIVVYPDIIFPGRATYQETDGFTPPGWATSFIVNLDSRYKEQGNQRQSVLGRDALDVLDHHEQEGNDDDTDA